MYILTIVQLFYTSLSIAAYTVMIFTVLSIRKNLKTFSTLLITSSFVNILGSLNVFVQSRLLRDPTFFGYYEWLKSGNEGLPYYLRIFHFTWFFTGWEMQYACVFLTTFNRFTAIVMYEKHEKLWRFSPLIFIFALGSVLASTIPNLNSIGTYQYRPLYNDYAQDYSADYNVAKRVFQFMAIYSTIYILPSTLMIVWSLGKVRNISTSTKCFQAIVHLERNLFIISLINFSAMLINFISFLILLTWQLFFPQVQTLQDFLDIFYPICSDIFCLSLPYYTLLLPGPVNSEILRILRRGKLPYQATSVVRPTTTNIA